MPLRRVALGYVIKIVNENCSTERVYCRNIDTFIDAINVIRFKRERQQMLMYGRRAITIDYFNIKQKISYKNKNRI